MSAIATKGAPFQVVFRDCSFLGRDVIVIDVDADPAVAGGATPKVTIGVPGVTTDLVGTVTINGGPISAGAPTRTGTVFSSPGGLVKGGIVRDLKSGDVWGFARTRSTVAKAVSGVATADAVNGGQVTIADSGIQAVALDEGLTVLRGDVLYASDSFQICTNDPSRVNSNLIPVGVVVDETTYDGTINSTALARLILREPTSTPKIAMFSFAGSNGAGPISVSGLPVGTKLIGAYNITDAAASLVGDDFDQAIATADTLSQTSATDLSGKTFLAWFELAVIA